MRERREVRGEEEGCEGKANVQQVIGLAVSHRSDAASRGLVLSLMGTRAVWRPARAELPLQFKFPSKCACF